MYLCSKYILCSYYFSRKELGNMFPKPKNQYIYICDLENDQIRSFWPHFQVEHFVHGMDMLRRVYGTLLYGSLCCGIFSELLELGHAVSYLHSSSYFL